MLVKSSTKGNVVMNHLKTAIAVVLVFAVTGAIAQSDPDPDGIGIYFDQGATTNSTVVAEGTSSVTAYLILTNPTIGGNLVHWAARVSCDPNSQASISGLVYNGSNIDVDNMPGSSHWNFEASVNQQPYPVSEITLLAELSIYSVSYSEPIYLFVTEGPEYPAYGTDEGWAYYHPSSGSLDLPVAVINGEAPVPTENQSWGQLKSLFR